MKSSNSDIAFTAIILAAGKGTRMKSPLPKVLHPVAGVPMLKKAIDAMKVAGAHEVRVVVGFGENLVRKVVEPMGVTCFTQAQQLGTADAVRAAQAENIKTPVIIANGDHPLLTAEMIKKWLREHIEAKVSISVITSVLKEPGSFGRIVRSGGELRAIVEAGDATRDTLKINEVNTGIYILAPDALSDFLPKIQNHNSKKEFYLTDLVALAQEADERILGISGPPEAAFGVNSQKELAKATQILFKRKISTLMDEGVLVVHPKSTFVEDDVQVGQGSVLYPGVYLRGNTKIGTCCVLEPNCYLKDVIVEDSVHIRAGSYLEECTIHSRATIGPYSRLRPGTDIGVEAHVGNFVEMKKTKFGARSKAGHLSYLGDAQIGEDVNIGCGTITCNFAPDRSKYRTVIGNGVFVGSDTQFVAPIEIGDDAVIGSGSTITKNVPARALAVARGKQFIKENYVAPPGPSDEAEEGSSEKKDDSCVESSVITGR